MKMLAATTLLLAAMATAGLASAQSPTPSASGESSRAMGTGSPVEPSTPPGSGGDAAKGVPGVGSPSSAIPDSTGGSRTPGTSASGAKADCPAAIARGADRDRGSAGTGSGYSIFGPNASVTNADCPTVGSGATSGDSGSAGTGRSSAPPVSPGTGVESSGSSNPRGSMETGPVNGIGR